MTAAWLRGAPPSRCSWSRSPARADGRASPRDVVQTTADQVIAVLGREGPLQGRAPRAGEGDRHGEHRLRHALPPGPGAQLEQLHPRAAGGVQARVREPLSATYGRRLDDYRNEKMAITGEPQGGQRRLDGADARSCAAAARTTSWSTTGCGRSNGQWKVIDVILEQVSLVANFRSQFQEILATAGPEKLLQVLREKTAKGRRSSAYADFRTQRRERQDPQPRPRVRPSTPRCT